MTMRNNPVALASDHAGFEQKQQVVAWLANLGFEVHDLGPATDERVDYPDFADKVAQEVASGTAACGILICGTGIGMAMASNKRPGIRAANITSPPFATLAREHNNANVLTLSGRFIDLATNKEIIDNFLVTEFGEGRHATRVKKLENLERLEPSGGVVYIRRD
jgi:ribose 5-phosphate isomerase B